MALHHRITAVGVLALALAFAGAGSAAHRSASAVGFVVNLAGSAGDADTGDGACDSDLQAPGDQCTLNAAIQQATARSATAPVNVSFDIPATDPVIQGAYSFGPGSTIDGTTEPGYAPGAPAVTIQNLAIDGDTLVRGVAVKTGIEALGDDNRIQGNFIGLEPDGRTAFGEGGIGVRITGNDNTIGGPDAADRNVISGLGVGIDIDGAFGGERNASDNKIVGNLIGLDADGKKGPGNSEGIIVTGAVNTTIGGKTPSARNVISGSHGIDTATYPGYGIVVTYSRNTTISGNYVGTTEDGKAAFGNALAGIAVSSSSTLTTIGGVVGGPRTSCSGLCNLVSGNNGPGISSGGGTQSLIAVVIDGNFIGTDVTGEHSLGNRTAGVAVGGGGTVIGGLEERQRQCTVRCNLISGNHGAGISINGHGTYLDGVSGNFIGTDLTGKKPVGNDIGIELDNQVNAQIGGKSAGSFTSRCDAGCNVISGNQFGIKAQCSTTEPSTLSILGNVIGLDRTGASDKQVENQIGIAFINCASGTIGGVDEGRANLIGGNHVVGIRLTQSSNVSVLGNRIGVSATGSPAPNGLGVHVYSRSFGDKIGGSAGTDLRAGCTGACNVISSNTDGGVWVERSSGIKVQGDYIGVTPDGDHAAPNGAYGVLVSAVDPSASLEIQKLESDLNAPASRNLVGGTADEGNLISGNDGDGVEIADYVASVENGASDNSVLGNFIGTDRSGEQALPNRQGVEIKSANKNRIGSPAAPGNVIAGNREAGVVVYGNGNRVQLNVIGLSKKKDVALSNGGLELQLVFGQGNTITKNVVLAGARAVTVEPAAKAENDVSGNTETKP